MTKVSESVDKSSDNPGIFADYPYYIEADMAISRTCKLYLGKKNGFWPQAILLSRLNLDAGPVLYSRAIDLKKPESMVSGLQGMTDSFGGLPSAIRFGGLIPKAVEPVIQAFADSYGIDLVNTPLQPGIFPDWFFTEEKFRSPAEIMREARIKTQIFNNQPVPGLSICRSDLLLIESHHLQPFPEEVFDPDFSADVKVQINGHIELAGMYYSVPWQYRNEPLSVRYNQELVKVYQGDREICRHHRLRGYPGRYCTVKEHMLPPEKAELKDWSADRIQRWAAQVGPATREVVNYYLDRGYVPQQGFKICVSLLSLSRAYSCRQLEDACRHELDTNRVRPSFRNIRNSFRTPEA